MEIQRNVLLAPYTTFKIGGQARYFCVVHSIFEAKEAFEFAQKNHLNIFIIGGGSNVLISDKGFDGLVLKLDLDRVTAFSEDAEYIWLEIGASANWDEVVKMAVDNGWWGIENLSHIPGNSGAIAVQNVGAYGQEASQIIESVATLDIKTLSKKSFNKEQCEFGYRRSIFNSSQKGRYLIYGIYVKLKKNGQPNLSYRDLAKYFANKSPTLADIRKAIIEIRDKKYPFPTENKNGNVGSFFKNPSLTIDEYQSVLINIAQSINAEAVAKIEHRKFMDNDKIKIPAALLIELCGLKELAEGGACINHNQPLVIVNASGSATAVDVLKLAKKVIEEVYKKTGIKLSIEPELVGFLEN
ncbi:MAG: UDP-N-acetylmuramate dehydrogenase [Candidatus Doudnabacteria bacterium]|nr:UDP-N-acetylmuramate dehydrogenase [Candidatus Doudnabacteria bacterium]